jgi:uncharacterized membrane protein (DUF106 family)
MLDDSEITRLLREILEVLRDNNAMGKARGAEATARLEKLQEQKMSASETLKESINKAFFKLVIWLTIVVVVAVVTAVFVIEKLSN